MRITDLKASVVTTGLPWDSHNPDRGEMTAILVQIFTDADIVGVAFTWERLSTGRGLAETLVKAVKPFLLGKDPLDREMIWQTLVKWNVKGLPMIGSGSVDVALWDIAGKALRLPLYKLMGAYRDKLLTYASTTVLKTPADYGVLARQLKRQGYTAMKLHIRGVPKWDVEACQAARDGAGPDMTIMLDSSGHYGRQDALWVGREIEKLNFYWFETPIADSDVEGLAELARVLDIPIATTEYLYECGPSHFVPYLTGKAADVVRTDARRGITLAKKVSDLCAAFDVNCELHSWGSIIGQAANLHVMGAIKNCVYFEQPVPVDRFEVCAQDRLRIDEEGYMHLPTKPGIGVELDWDEVDRRTVFSN